MSLASQIAASLAKGTPVTVDGTATTAIKKSVTQGASEWLPQGVGSNAAASDPSQFFLPAAVDAKPGAQIVHVGTAYTVVDARPQMDRGAVACRIVRAYLTPAADSDTAETNGERRDYEPRSAPDLT
jgi:hypothetical protein